MSVTDAEMMEAEALAPPQAWSSNSDPSDVPRNLLAMARQLVDQGKPSQALQAVTFILFLPSPSYLLIILLWLRVVMAMKIQGGDEAVAQVLNRARELYRNKTQALSMVDELASLFAECAIAKAMPMPSKQNNFKIKQMPSPLNHTVKRLQYLLRRAGSKSCSSVYSDGSSFICLQCGGLVNNHRKEEHHGFKKQTQI
ncbi:hypothetical protein CDL12_01099 [Handroanthus impetiginosus]|uniref:C2HC zinc finger plants domain-containing protein n=1 Tax=Handroanthus impetiginosus TaxID=429701 RepID=A0A2G9I8R0_9LAMI|nr:hypothetical protein CDL12_01099 [Handroanthus impetiginosus]